MLIEFPGGINFNTIGKNEKDDKVKIVTKTIEVLKFTKAMSSMNCPISQSYVRFFGEFKYFLSSIKIVVIKNLFYVEDGKITFEAIWMLEKD